MRGGGGVAVAEVLPGRERHGLPALATDVAKHYLDLPFIVRAAKSVSLGVYREYAAAFPATVLEGFQEGVKMNLALFHAKKPLGRCPSTLGVPNAGALLSQPLASAALPTLFGGGQHANTTCCACLARIAGP